MHGRAHHHLGGLQIYMPCFAAGGEEDAEQLSYFARDFLLDRFRRFFPWADGTVSTTGRNWQIFSLTSNSCSPSSRNL